MKYFGWAVSIILVIIVGSSVYQQINKTGAKAKRLACHENVTVFEKVHKKDLLESVQNAISSSSVTIQMQKEESQYMDTKLFEYVDIQKKQEEFRAIVQKMADTQKDQKDVQLDILVYENDKKDPGKKSKKAKLYAGYLVCEFSYKQDLVYKIQIDFMDMQGKDINKRFECVLQSLMSL